MNYIENYLLTRLRAGEDPDAIAQELTNALNEANEIQKKTNKKRKAVTAFVEALADLFDAYGAQKETVDTIRNEDIDKLVEEIEELVLFAEEYGKLLLDEDKKIWSSVSHHSNSKSKNTDPIENFLNKYVR